MTEQPRDELRDAEEWLRTLEFDHAAFAELRVFPTGHLQTINNAGAVFNLLLSGEIDFCDKLVSACEKVGIRVIHCDAEPAKVR